MFTEMHVMYAAHRGKAKEARFDPAVPDYPEVTVREILESATIKGAEGCALDHKVGTLTPGKEADIVLIDANDIAIFPTHNAFCTVVEGASPGNVHTVIIGGKIRKSAGKLVGYDLDAIKTRSADSRDYLFNATGWPRGVIDFSD
jgi:cytosine/adenosine deaminase-related metal-dependent hydrolase